MILKSNLDMINELLKVKSVTSNALKNNDYQWQIIRDYCEFFGETCVSVSGETLV